MTANTRRSRLSSKDHYQVKFPDNNGMFYGVANTSSFETRVQQEAQHGRIVVEHAVFPRSVAVPEECLIDIPLDFGVQYDEETGLHWGGDEYHNYVALQSLLHEIRHDRLSVDKLCAGHLFHIPVGDGRASYCITSVKRTLCTIEWRGFCLDRWTARPWGWGGEYRRKDVEPLVLSDIRLTSMLADDLNARRKKHEQAAARFLREFTEHYGLPRDLQGISAELELSPAEARSHPS
jgi:hypothetical protein